MNDTVWVTKLGLAVVAVVLVMVTSRYVSSVYSVGSKTAFAVSMRSLQHLTKPWRCHGDAMEMPERHKRDAERSQNEGTAGKEKK
jgi:hypothetical protein